MFFFLASLMLLLVLAGCTVVGFYIITRKEKIFKYWSLFWEQTTGEVTKVFLEGQDLENKYNYLVQCSPHMATFLGMSPSKKCLIVKGEMDAWQQQNVNDLLGCRSTLFADVPAYLTLYTEHPVYYFHELIRYPLSQCPPCMASIGGSLIYWPVILLQKNVFAWTDYTWQPYFFFWACFCTALAFVNKYLYSKVS